MLPIGSRDRFLAVDGICRCTPSSFVDDAWPLFDIFSFSDWKSLAIVLLEVLFSAGNILMYHLSESQMTIIDVQNIIGMSCSNENHQL